MREGHDLNPVEPEVVVQAVEPEAGLFTAVDPLGFADALAHVGSALTKTPDRVAAATQHLAGDLTSAWTSAVLAAFGAPLEPAAEPDQRDRRFKEPEWTRDPRYFLLGQSYLLWSRWLLELVDAADVDGPTKLKAEFAVRGFIDALAPTNVLPGNPRAMRRAVETGGVSVLKGAANMLSDVLTNKGRPRQVDTSAFEVGRNLAATKGKVVFRNHLMELLQYEPQTETTYEVPLLLSPPWINRYYVMDLAPGRSFAEWAVQHGHTVFAISYRNPDASMRNVALDDYLVHGPHAALDVIADITGSEQVNIGALCLGGTLTAALLAHLAHRGEERVRTATLLNTLVDFSEPGPLGTFTDARSVRELARKMVERGYLDGSEMALTFDLLRANDLIWNYVASNWLMGERPPAFDILAWNGDTTRMPAKMHEFYLRYCYGENQLARGEMELAGTPLRLEEIREEVYVLAAKEDHIAPWTSAYKATHLFGGPVRFVLSSAGHIAGIVNPPGPKPRHWTRDDNPADPMEWLAGASEQPGSWWEDWALWIAERAGDRREPPPMGSEAHPPLEDAPGTYVHEK
ncbi:MAG: alpha/beta fold hydrolase [Solirubrobacterales bacterium]|nr:alpha/beta fold hydrolase [Solirubrobacterales bacterium]